MKTVNKIKYLSPFAVLFAPLVSWAATTQNLGSVIALIASYMNKILALLMGLAVVMFVWYVIKYFILTGNDTKRAEAAQYVMWSLIGFFVILSMWGLVNILISTFNLGVNGTSNSNPASWGSLRSIFPK